jgi:hypothetical protein
MENAVKTLSISSRNKTWICWEAWRLALNKSVELDLAYLIDDVVDLPRDAST